MKNKFIAKLLFLVTIMLLLYSCRNELTPEQETYNNSGQFRPTSQTIRLEQSKHKLVLKTELQKVQNNLTEIKTNSSGKTVDFTNGVSIATDNVTYIEYGPTFHTYTFNLVRENTPENAPLENLVLSSLPDGTYKELLVTYNFTPQEKFDLLAGKGVKTAGKTTAIELAKGTYGGVISNRSMGGTESCSYQTVDMYFSCYTGDHNQTNESTWGSCNWQSQGGYPAQHLTVVALVCGADTSLDDGTGNGGGTSVGDTRGLGSGPNEGTPTIPTFSLASKASPCEKTKVMLNRPNVQQGINNVKGNAKLSVTNPNIGELGFKEKKDGTVVLADINSAHQVVFKDITDGYGGYHNHTATGIHMFSPPDIVDTLFGFAAAQSVYDGVGNAYFGMIAGEPCNTCPDNVKYIHYVIRYVGTGTELANFVYSPEQMKQILIDYQKKEAKLTNTSISGTSYINSAGDLNEKGLEKLFFDTLTNMGLDNKVVLQRVEPNGTVYNVTKDITGSITATPCP
ncbi:hypothetical protein HX13_03250 [Chryseobacterium sp. P1-3]|uniref:hypothetical protein n=1 Tax=Chryseobacterium sp. (strain P1-3) TaxID=1517683 RepID=UPI0004E72D40|nr:hypothetical protein [Chryseobacterium sp. P1-3]KFF75275.1 hypothetical protein HX13_03250 [Chryseobacterium sp. P1-3]